MFVLARGRSLSTQRRREVALPRAVCRPGRASPTRGEGPSSAGTSRCSSRAPPASWQLTIRRHCVEGPRLGKGRGAHTPRGNLEAHPQEGSDRLGRCCCDRRHRWFRLCRHTRHRDQRLRRRQLRTLRVVASGAACKANATPLSWNQQGSKARPDCRAPWAHRATPVRRARRGCKVPRGRRVPRGRLGPVGRPGLRSSPTACPSACCRPTTPTSTARPARSPSVAGCDLAGTQSGKPPWQIAGAAVACSANRQAGPITIRPSRAAVAESPPLGSRFGVALTLGTA